jgi:hypothetical protein
MSASKTMYTNEKSIKVLRVHHFLSILSEFITKDLLMSLYEQTILSQPRCNWLFYKVYITQVLVWMAKFNQVRTG